MHNADHPPPNVPDCATTIALDSNPQIGPRCIRRVFDLQWTRRDGMTEGIESSILVDHGIQTLVESNQ